VKAPADNEGLSSHSPSRVSHPKAARSRRGTRYRTGRPGRPQPLRRTKAVPHRVRGPAHDARTCCRSATGITRVGQLGPIRREMRERRPGASSGTCSVDACELRLRTPLRLTSGPRECRRPPCRPEVAGGSWDGKLAALPGSTTRGDALGDGRCTATRGPRLVVASARISRAWCRRCSCPESRPEAALVVWESRLSRAESG
jgi:hypothetical protein